MEQRVEGIFSGFWEAVLLDKWVPVQDDGGLE